MIYIDLDKVKISATWIKKAKELTTELASLPDSERATYIESKRAATWGNRKVLEALRSVAGNKCWYTEVSLTGADPNIDHFRPKGTISEVDCDLLKDSGTEVDGYWWLAFEPQNFRLACMHANQRRNDIKTNGGKWNFFPVDGKRAAPQTKLKDIKEDVVPFDPCSKDDMSKIWFSPDGELGYNDWNHKPNLKEERRIKVTNWLYHLDKQELKSDRVQAMIDIGKDLKRANAFYKVWQQMGGGTELEEKQEFDEFVSDIKIKIDDNSPFAGAKRCVLNLERSKYLWMDEYFPI